MHVYMSMCVCGSMWARATGRRHEWLSLVQAILPSPGAFRGCSELSLLLFPPLALPYSHDPWHCPLAQRPQVMLGGLDTEGCPDVPEALTSMSVSPLNFLGAERAGAMRLSKMSMGCIPVTSSSFC